jgi:hypothetical protein
MIKTGKKVALKEQDRILNELNGGQLKFNKEKIEECLEKAAEKAIDAVVFKATSKPLSDLHSGFWQVPIPVGDQHGHLQ